MLEDGCLRRHPRLDDDPSGADGERHLPDPGLDRTATTTSTASRPTPRWLPRSASTRPTPSRSSQVAIGLLRQHLEPERPGPRHRDRRRRGAEHRPGRGDRPLPSCGPLIWPSMHRLQARIETAASRPVPWPPGLRAGEGDQGGPVFGVPSRRGSGRRLPGQRRDPRSDLRPPGDQAGAASTDMANISLVMPTIHPSIGLDCAPAVNHQPEFTAHCATGRGRQVDPGGGDGHGHDLCRRRGTRGSLRDRLLAGDTTYGGWDALPLERCRSGAERLSGDRRTVTARTEFYSISGDSGLANVLHRLDVHPEICRLTAHERALRRRPDRVRTSTGTGPVAVTTVRWPPCELAVDPDGGLRPGEYQLKTNSYDLGVDIELRDLVERLRFEHPEVKAVVVTGGLDKIFCAGANIQMLATSSHAWTRSTSASSPTKPATRIEDATATPARPGSPRSTGRRPGVVTNWPWPATRSCWWTTGNSAVSLPEVPLLAVLPGTGGLTRLVDKRKVRRDRADAFCHPDRGHSRRQRGRLEAGRRREPRPRGSTTLVAEAVTERVAPRRRGDRGAGRRVALDPDPGSDPSSRPSPHGPGWEHRRGRHRPGAARRPRSPSGPRGPPALRPRRRHQGRPGPRRSGPWPRPASSTTPSSTSGSTSPRSGPCC